MSRLQLGHRSLSEDVTVLMIDGEVDAATSQQLRDRLHQIRSERTRAGHLVLDLGGMRLIAAAGIRVLVEEYDYLARHGGSISMAALQPHALRVFDITQLSTYMSVHPTVGEAVEAASAASPVPPQ